MEFKDKVGATIDKFDEVYVPEPSGSDIHNFEFVGSVDGFKDGLVTVSDMENNCFDIEPERLIKIGEE